MNDAAKRFVASVKEHGETRHYYGATAEEAMQRARSRTLGPNWDGIIVFQIPAALEENAK